ncbi:MAG: chemotaxis response regulator protein-glutamate methylesterase [Planctomycetota bacterium]
MPIRVLVVDDSVFMRRAIRGMLEAESDIEVVATARNGREGVELAKEHRPDVVTLDIEMPEMDGLTALRRIKREAPTQVLMCSSLTTEGSQASLQALRLGAADVIAKDHSTFSVHVDDMREDLVNRVRAIGQAGQRKRVLAGQGGGGERGSLRSDSKPSLDVGRLGMICIGSSTGGPPVLETVLPAIPAGVRAPIVVAQHMPKLFTKSLTARLSEICPCPVVMLEDNQVLRPGVIHMAPGGIHAHLRHRGTSTIYAHLDEEPKTDLYRPSVDVLFETAAQATDRAVLGVVLTGIGQDGLRGAGKVKDRRGTIWSQSESSCVVYGMPKAVWDAKLSTAQLEPETIAEAFRGLAAKKAA